jgi:uncharacterized protein (TIGR02391 family)
LTPASLKRLERLARSVHSFSGGGPADDAPVHPFDLRNIHPDLPGNVRQLFDDGHCAQATFEALKYLDRRVDNTAGAGASGEGLMLDAFKEKCPRIKLTPLATISDVDEQRGYKFLFAGAVAAIRNRRGHELVRDDPDTCLDHLGLVSMLMRRLDAAGV